MIELFQHLLPRGKAWSITVAKQLRGFFEGLSPTWTDIQTYYQNIYKDMRPGTTRAPELWESQFGLATPLEGEARVERLSNAWSASGGQSPRYIQDTLQAAGFDVYVHEWWDPISGDTRNPLLYLNDGSSAIKYRIEAGEPLAEAGEPLAEAGEVSTPIGYALVNKITEVQVGGMDAGEPLAEAGEPLAEAGEILGLSFISKNYVVSSDPGTFPYYVYIGGEIFPSPANIDITRRDEFERLCLKICPTHLWIGVLVSYE